MSKIDELEKNIKLFERLAFYGDRKNFLKSLAQDAAWNDVAKRQGDLPEGSPIPPPRDNLPLQVPEKTIVGNPPKPFTPPDPGTVNMLQVFLNRAFRQDIIDGKLGPVGQDSTWGPETENRLKLWAQRNQVPSNDLTALINTVTSRARA